MVNIIIENAKSYIARALMYTEKISKTNVINVEYLLGQYMACMDLLKVADFDKYLELAEKHKADREKILRYVNNIYLL